MSNDKKSIKETIAKSLLYYRKKAKLTQKEFAEKLGVKNSAVSNWETGVNSIDIDTLFNACEILGVTINDMYNVKQEDGFSDHEKSLIKKYRSLDSYGREIIDTVLDLELKRYEDFLRDVSKEINSYKHETGIIQLPYFDLPVSAGSGVFLDSDTYEILDVPDTAASRQATYAVRVSGDSMEPDFQNGDKILVRQQPTLEIGDLGIFILNGEGYFKEYGGDCLISLNKAYEPIKILADDSIYIKGKVIGKL